tara:strand:- start:4180 stop:5232 length:1053 start_codon:yes stop_codon:yes gene_type:complete
MTKRKISYEFDDSLIDIIREYKIPKILEDDINFTVKEILPSKKKYEYYQNIFINVIYLIIQYCNFNELYILNNILKQLSIKLNTDIFQMQNIIKKKGINLFSLIAKFNRSDLIPNIIKYMKFIDINDAYMPNEFNFNSFDLAIENNNINYINEMTKDKIKKYQSHTEKYKLHNNDDSITKIYKIALIHGDFESFMLCKNIYYKFHSAPINILENNMGLTIDIFMNNICTKKIYYIYIDNYKVLLNLMLPIFTDNYFTIFDILYSKCSGKSRCIKFLVFILIIQKYNPNDYKGFYKKEFLSIYKNLQDIHKNKFNKLYQDKLLSMNHKDLINLQDNELVYLDSFSFGLKLS